ncbi:prosolanapyrone-II oxidase [Microdochium nivale]|nr:prosolanapyrone-II oxidase [Microdochium nivale]
MIDNRYLAAAVITAAAVLVVSLWIWRTWPIGTYPKTAASAADRLAALAATYKRLAALPPPAEYISHIAAALPPGRVVLPQDDPAAFTTAMDAHFATQNRAIEPSCVVQPASVDELSIAVKHIAREHTLRSTQPATGPGRGLFAVRCTGANPAQGVAGVKDGILLDLSRLDSIALSADKSLLTVGGGCTWASIYAMLDPLELTVVGGRSSPVGVGGSTLGGGMSFYSGRYGLMCGNVARYTVVLADGSIVTASESENPDLWRALKGGLNNFGVVAEFVLHVYPGGPLWASLTISPSFFTGSCLKAYYDHGVQAAREETFDENVSTPIVCLVYMPDTGISVWSTQLFYALGGSSTSPTTSTTKEPRKLGDKTWPSYWKRSPLGRIWGVTTSSGVVPHGRAVANVGDMALRDVRNMFTVTGFRLDLPTMRAAVDIFNRHKAQLAVLRPGGTVLCMVFQTLNPRWMNKGQPNVLGLEACEDPLVVLEFTCNWVDAAHDGLVERVMRTMISEIEEASVRLGSAHAYRFTNYASSWQRPLEGYGEENLRFLREVSKRYDPQGLFQTGCLGGFKLGREDL